MKRLANLETKRERSRNSVAEAARAATFPGAHSPAHPQQQAEE